MNFVNKLIAGAMLMSPTLTTSAAEFPWLTFVMADETELSVAADNLSLNYADGNLLLTSQSANETLPTAQIKSMRFTSTPASVDAIGVEASFTADYYTPSGISVGRFGSIDEARDMLPAGIYIVKCEQKTFKLIL